MSNTISNFTADLAPIVDGIARDSIGGEVTAGMTGLLLALLIARSHLRDSRALFPEQFVLKAFPDL